MDELDTFFEFPCSYPLKVIGKNSGSFQVAVLSILSQHVGQIDQGSYTSRLSGGGKYISFTITFEAQSKDQLNQIYRELKAHELVIMTL